MGPNFYQVPAWHRIGGKLLPEPVMVKFLTSYGVT